METAKAHDRRVREGFYDLYTRGDGLDIGGGRDRIPVNCYVWDRPNDAHDLGTLPSQGFTWVYSSHCLEHLERPEVALREWWRVLQSGGHLIVVVPHRDLYEKRRAMPSRWNHEHKFFMLPDEDEPPCTFGLAPMVRRALGREPFLVSLRVHKDGWKPLPEDQHSIGEYSIEGIWRKP